MADWREEILQGVKKVVFQGFIPGVIVVFGENAHSILANKKGQVLCAAAEHGNGRIVVFSHGIFVKSFIKENEVKIKNQRLNKNIIKWLTRGEYEVTKVYPFEDYIENLDSLPSECKILAWCESTSPKQESLNKLLEWVKKGGGLICGGCSWGFVQLHKKGVENMPLNSILQHIGVAFAGKMMYKNEGDAAELLIEHNTAPHAKPQHIVSAIKEMPDKATDLGDMMHGVLHLPDNHYQALKHHVIEVIQTLAKDEDYNPSRSRPVKTIHGKKAAGLHCEMLIRDGKDGKEVVANCIEEFPGTFTEQPEIQCVSLSLSSTGFRYHPTGCYLPAGTVMEVSWTKAKKPWKVLIGLHKDKLFDIGGHLRRWPKVSIKRELTTSPLKICSPFGGLVYFVSPKRKDRIDVKLSNVVPAPMFTYNTADSWESVERYKPGLWCDIIGDMISFTIPSSSVRKLPDLTKTMQMWDSVVSLNIEIRGKDASDGRGQWVITDEQPKIGQMHSGYPIVTHLDLSDPNEQIHQDCFLLTGENIREASSGKRNWGLFHELGHNFQNRLWTWKGTSEVTCNIFTLHAADVIYSLKPWEHPWLRNKFDKTKRYLQADAPFDKWCSNAGIALIVYAQLARDFGWNSYYEVFKDYDDLPNSKHPKTNTDKEDMWITTYSKVVKRNLCPLFDFWGWPIRDQVLENVKKFPIYMPDDETTNDFAPNRASKITKKYSSDGVKDSPYKETDEVKDITDTIEISDEEDNAHYNGDICFGNQEVDECETNHDEL